MACTGSERVGPRHHRGTAMEHYAGIDVSLGRSSVCVVDATGRIVREDKVASEPEALAGFFAGLGLAVVRIGLEAGPGGFRNEAQRVKQSGSGRLCQAPRVAPEVG